MDARACLYGGAHTLAAHALRQPIIFIVFETTRERAQARIICSYLSVGCVLYLDCGAYICKCEDDDGVFVRFCRFYRIKPLCMRATATTIIARALMKMPARTLGRALSRILIVQYYYVVWRMRFKYTALNQPQQPLSGLMNTGQSGGVWVVWEFDAFDVRIKTHT